MTKKYILITALICLILPVFSSTVYSQVKKDGEAKVYLEKGSEPAWSPDGKRLLITSGKYPDTEIFLINADGSNAERLTENSFPDHYPVWSPDGKSFAFSSRRGGVWKIILMSADRVGEEKIVAETSKSEHNPSRISFSPDGRLLTFAADRDGNSEIYTFEIESKKLNRLTENPARDNAPVFSPDGKSIAFESNRDGDMEIYVMNADGSEPKRITNSKGPDILPVWFPDGKKIGFLTGRHIVRNAQGGHAGGVINWEIYKALPDGSKTVRLTENNYWDFYPSFSPDGSRVAFVSIREGHTEGSVYVMKLNGTDVVRLTKGNE